MSSEKKTEPISEFLAKSEKGLWVKVARYEEEIRVEWQPRYVTEDGHLCTIDANGDVESRRPIHEARYDDDPYRLAGTIPVTDEMVEFAGLVAFEKFIYGVMRHVTYLIVGGWGDSPEEVVGWFQNFGNVNTLDIPFLIIGDYKVVGPEWEPIVGLNGLTISLDYGEEFIEATIKVVDSNFDFPLDTREVITAFLISTIPVT